MNQTDRKRLRRLVFLIVSVPYPQAGGGAKTASMNGFIAYQNDMRNLLPALDRVIMGMLCEDTPELKKGEDYDDPDVLLDNIERWIEKRKRENWVNIPEYDLRYFCEETN